MSVVKIGGGVVVMVKVANMEDWKLVCGHLCKVEYNHVVN